MPDIERPFVVEPIGDLAAAGDAARHAAATWRLPAPVLMRVGMNAIFRSGDIVLRVGRPTAPPEQAIWLAEWLTEQGIRVPRPAGPMPVSVNGLAVFAVERVIDHGPVDWRRVGEMVAALHRLPIAAVRGRYPVPWCATFPWWQHATLLDELEDDAAGLGDPAALIALRRCIESSHGWRDTADSATHVLCHGDVHPGNVVQSADGPVLLDWDLLCEGPPAWDHAALARWHHPWGGSPAVYREFVAGYGSSFEGQWLGEALADLRLVSATLLRLRAGRRAPAAAAEARLRLRWWRGDGEASTWTAQ
jgi:Ser/Thr protein kinase RdoA (MazF antagonist)